MRIVVVMKVIQVINDPALLTGEQAVVAARNNITIGNSPSVEKSAISAGKIYGASSSPSLGQGTSDFSGADLGV